MVYVTEDIWFYDDEVKEKNFQWYPMNLISRKTDLLPQHMGEFPR